MKDKKRKTNKKTKLLIIAGAISLGIIVLSVGLGVGLSDNNDTTTKQKEVIRNNYQLIEEGEGDNKEVIVRLNENTTFDQIKTEVEQIKKDLNGKTITELRLPYGTRSEFQTKDADGNTKLDLDKIKNELGIEIDESKVGYVFYPSDETDETKTYQNQNIFEVVLPKTQKNIANNKFRDNKIRKVNFEELIELENIGDRSFQGNKFSEKVIIPGKVKNIYLAAFKDSQIKELDLSKAKSLLKIHLRAFRNNQISGTLFIPPKLVTIGDTSFLNNKIEYLDLSEAVGFKFIDEAAFSHNNIRELDFSKATSLIYISSRAFEFNNIEKLNLNAPLLNSIQQDSFANNVVYGTQTQVDPLPDGFIFTKKMKEIWSGNFYRPYTIGETRKVVFVPKQISELQNGAFSSGYAVYKAEVDISILKYKLELLNGVSTLTFDNDTTIGDVIIRQDLIKAENAKRKIDKFVFPTASITKFGDGEEFSKTSKRLLGLKKYLGLSEAVDTWIAGTTNP